MNNKMLIIELPQIDKDIQKAIEAYKKTIALSFSFSTCYWHYSEKNLNPKTTEKDNIVMLRNIKR